MRSVTRTDSNEYRTLTGVISLFSLYKPISMHFSMQLHHFINPQQGYLAFFLDLSRCLHSF